MWVAQDLASLCHIPPYEPNQRGLAGGGSPFEFLRTRPNGSAALNRCLYPALRKALGKNVTVDFFLENLTPDREKGVVRQCAR